MSSEGDLCAFFYARGRRGKYVSKADGCPARRVGKSFLLDDIRGVRRKKEKDGIMDEKVKNFSSAFCFVFTLRDERLRKGKHKPCR